ncbi:MAG TPA: ribulose-phosphate 3-epimerase [Bacteroidota bacterium]|nr:ribulose-phosphate 3-epimerase [Bacteroidota bacterium]
MNKVLIAPSILASDLLRLGEQIQEAEQGGADWIHIDIMDGHFVPNISFGVPIVQLVRRSTQLPLDVHLMITSPELYIDKFRNAGADIITIHQEATPHLNRLLSYIKEIGALAGVSLNPSTPVSTISEVLDIVDLVLLMTVNPGWGGQKFIERSYQRIQQCVELIQKSGRNIYLEVDGGIDTQTAPGVVKAGANVLVAGTSVFGSRDVKNAIAQLNNSFLKNSKV